MSAENEKFEPALESVIEEIRQESVEDYVVDAAAARVWARLRGEAAPHAVEHIRSCADFQSLIPDYRAGKLSDARATLLKDHTHECVACRKALDAASGKVVAFPGAGPAAGRPVRSRPMFRWAIAAAVVFAVGMGAWSAIGYFGGVHVRPTVQTVNGALYRVADNGLQPLAAGAGLPNGVEIRTAKDSGAVLQLSDGSVVEMRERSGFSVSDGGTDLTVRLARGSIIVQAAKRRRGHLYVATADCRVAVTGTVFSVSAGVKGSRVSVIEGSVQVAQGGAEKVLKPGEQTTTSPAMEPLPVKDDIAWSRNFDKHLALLRDVAALRQSLEQVRMPDLRYASRLTATLPANVVVYASLPNLGPYLAESQAVMQQKLAESPILREWWQQRGAVYEALIAKLRSASEFLGDEIVMVSLADGSGRVGAPVLLAESRRAGLAEHLQREGVPVRIAKSAAELAQAGGPALWTVEQPGMVLMSPQPDALRRLLDEKSGGFTATPLGQRVAAAYAAGAGLLVCADLERLPGSKADATGKPEFAMLEQKQVASKTETRAVVGFAGGRPGVASWLAAPAPLGALDYISPDATLVSAFAINAPAKILEDAMGKGIGPIPPLAAAGFDVKDIAASLGGEVAVAMDGPAFPTPSWKLVVEVYDANRLQYALNQMIQAVNANLAKAGKPPLKTAQETANGHTYYMIAGGDGNPLTEAHYVFSGGYLLMAPSRALLDRALQYRATGYTLPKSQTFAALVPHDHYANFSGLVYYNVGSTLAPLAGLLGGSGMLKPEQQKAIDDLSKSKPTLVTVYGEPDRISMASSGSFFGLSLNNILTGNVFGSGLMDGTPLAAHKHGTRAHGPAFR